MYCNCSNKENYEVIALCDIKKFADKNGPFNNKGWVQISVSDLLILDCNKLAIEKIEKIYINVSISNTKIIETPISVNPNSEGMTLTGKKLLVDGFICSKIVYTSLTKEQSVYTSKFTVPFCTYIVIESNTDVFNDKYCIKTCIEDVFLSLADCKTIFQNVTLFLVAEKNTITCPSAREIKENCWILKINQQIIFGNVAKIDFDINNNKDLKMIVTSTGNVENKNLNNVAYYLFKLRNSSNNIKLHSIIRANEDGSNFVTNLNNMNFQLDDIIELDSFEANKIAITNFPNAGEQQLVNTKLSNMEDFKKVLKITALGLEEFNPKIPLPKAMLQNTIKINKVDDTPMISLSFNTLDKIIEVSSFGDIADTSNSYNYVVLKLLDSNNKLITTATLPSNSTSSSFINNILFKIFDYNYFIDLTYDDRAKSHIIITNLQGKDHTPHEIIERYKLMPEGLIPVNIFLPNTININSINNSFVTSIKFNIIDKKLKVFSSTNVPDTSNEYNYIAVRLYAPSDIVLANPISTATLISNIKSSAFSDILNETSFNNDYVMKLNYDNRAIPHISITNFQGQGRIYTPNNTTEYFKINDNGLVPYRPSIQATSTAFIFKTLDTDKDMGMVDFDISNKKLVATSTGAVYNGQDTTSVFTFMLKNNAGTVTKKLVSINGNENADNFRNALNDVSFDLGDIVEVTFLNSSKINIINYPNKDDIYNMPLNSKSNSFIITKDGLVSYNFFESFITFKYSPWDIISTLNFNVVEKKLMVSSTGNKFNDRRNDKFFTIELKDTNGNIIKQASMNVNDTADSFRNTFNNESFEYNNIITIKCNNNAFDNDNAFYNNKNKFRNRDSIIINNYKNLGNDYVIFLQENSFRITKNGLEFIHNYLNSRMTFIGFFETIVINLRFNSDSKIFSVGAYNGEVDNAQFNNVECFGLILKDSNGKVKLEKSIRGDEIATNFSIGLNDIGFEYNDILSIKCLDITKYFISDYINYNNIKFPRSIENNYRITENGLVEAYNFLNNEILLYSSSYNPSLENYLVIKVGFNTDLKTLSVGNTLIVNRHNENKEYFALILKDNTGNIKAQSSVLGEKYAFEFSKELNKQAFEYDDIITLRYVNRLSVVISNYPNIGNKYNPLSTTINFRITENGLIVL